MRVHKRKPAHFHIGRFCLPSGPIWLVLFLSALILASCDSTGSVNITTSKDTPTPSEATSTPKSQVQASWQMQLEAAQKEAAKIDPSAVVHWIITSFTVAQLVGDNDIAVRTDFVFIRPNGVRIDIGMEDTSPPGVLYVVPAVDTWTVPPSPADLQRYASLLSNVKLGPRELFQRIFDKNIKYGPLIGVSMLLNWDHQQDVGIANPWEVSYEDLGKHTSIALWASPETGEIVKRDIYTLSP